MIGRDWHEIEQNLWGVQITRNGEIFLLKNFDAWSIFVIKDNDFVEKSDFSQKLEFFSKIQIFIFFPKTRFF